MRSERGFSLVEVVTAMALSLVVLLGLGRSGAFCAENQKFLGNPRPRREMMFFWISDAPPPMVSTTVYR